MKKTGFAFIAACMVLCGSLSAALPPLYQGIAELESILSNNELGNFLQSGDEIVNIRKTYNGYIIETRRQRLFARVVYLPMERGRVGPARFKIVFKSSESGRGRSGLGSTGPAGMESPMDEGSEEDFGGPSPYPSTFGGSSPTPSGSIPSFQR